MRETFFQSSYHSPLGTYAIVSSEEGIVCIKTEDRRPADLAQWERKGIVLEENGMYNLEVKAQLDAYFLRELRQFTVPLDLRGTPFQRQVWDVLCSIPWGQTRSYRQIAEALGRSNAARAVGRAVGSNPVSIVVPCHRVIGTNGGLTGYGGGLQRKAALLELETGSPFRASPDI